MKDCFDDYLIPYELAVEAVIITRSQHTVFAPLEMPALSLDERDLKYIETRDKLFRDIISLFRM